MSIRRLSAALLVLYFVTMPATARAETINCTAITTVPAVITLPGLYCLTASLTSSVATGPIIDIQANNVTLDLNGFRLAGLAAGPGTNAIGIYATNRQNITIRNGTVRGFLQGILLTCPAPCTSWGHLVEDIRADNNFYIGMQVLGIGVVVRNNQVVTTGGSTANGANSNTYGIYVSGLGSRVLNNEIIRVTGIGTGTAYGVYVGPSATGTMIVSNRITSADEGIHYAGAGKNRDNLTTLVTTPYSGGTDAGNNN